MQFKQEMAYDFRQLASALRFGYAGPPFAFTRYADGECAMLRGRPFDARRDNWEIAGKHPFAPELLKALACDAEGWYVGITAREHHATAHDYLMRQVRVPMERVTLAEVFIFGNYWRFCDLDLSHATTVGPKNADFLVPWNAIDPPWDGISDLVDELIEEADSPILVSAGPVGKILIHEYWQRTHGLRATIVDVGSAIDERLRGRRSRKYQIPTRWERSWLPQFKGAQ